jgi:hypothetical protein
MHWIGPDTGEIVVALIVRERTYWEDSRSKDIIVQHEAQGRMEWTRLDEDGVEIEPWDWARPRGAVRGSTSQGRHLADRPQADRRPALPVPVVANGSLSETP